MKKLALCLMTLVLCVCTLIAPVHATETFVPSISAKPAPEFVVVETLEDGTQVLGYVYDEAGNQLECVYPSCIIITSIADALDETKDIHEDIRKMLVDLYNDFLNGKIKLSEACPPLNDLVAAEFGEHNNADNLTIKDLFDIDFAHLDCEELLEKEGTHVKLKLNVDIEKDSFFAVIRYKNGNWELLEDYENNNDGTITITSETFCPVAVLVPGTMNAAPAPEQASFNWLYVIIPVAIACAGYVLSKKTKKA